MLFNIISTIFYGMAAIALLAVLCFALEIIIALVTVIGNEVCVKLGMENSYLAFTFRDLFVGIITISATLGILYWIGTIVVAL